MKKYRLRKYICIFFREQLYFKPICFIISLIGWFLFFIEVTFWHLSNIFAKLVQIADKFYTKVDNFRIKPVKNKMRKLGYALVFIIAPISVGFMLYMHRLYFYLALFASGFACLCVFAHLIIKEEEKNNL
jgi:hypothetical protein